MSQAGIAEELAKVREWHEEQQQDKEARQGRDGPAVLPSVLLTPPGFVGDVAAWIREQPRDPRDHLAVAAALSAVGNCAGAKYTCDMGGAANAFMFCVAGSSTGKERILKSQTALHVAAGINGMTHGKFKSEQEIIRNLLRDPSAHYLIDEIGNVLGQIKKASGNGGAAYLDGIVSTLMSIYSKTDSHLLLSGDVRRAEEEWLNKQVARLNSEIDRGGMGHDLSKKERDLERYRELIQTLETGIKNPFLSVMGYTNHATFESLMTVDWVANGFLARSLIFEDPENNPWLNPAYRPSEVPESIANQLKTIVSSGATEITTTAEARAALKDIHLHFWTWAGKLDPELMPIPRRGFEMVLKVSMILAIATGVRTEAFVEWAAALVQRDVELKIRKVKANDADSQANEAEALKSKILGKLSTDLPVKQSDVVNSLRKSGGRDAIVETLGTMEMLQVVKKVEETIRGRVVISWVAL